MVNLTAALRWSSSSDGDRDRFLSRASAAAAASLSARFSFCISTPRSLRDLLAFFFRSLRRRSSPRRSPGYERTSRQYTPFSQAYSLYLTVFASKSSRATTRNEHAKMPGMREYRSCWTG